MDHDPFPPHLGCSFDEQPVVGPSIPPSVVASPSLAAAPHSLCRRSISARGTLSTVFKPSWNRRTPSAPSWKCSGMISPPSGSFTTRGAGLGMSESVSLRHRLRHGGSHGLFATLARSVIAGRFCRLSQRAVRLVPVPTPVHSTAVVGQEGRSLYQDSWCARRITEYHDAFRDDLIAHEGDHSEHLKELGERHDAGNREVRRAMRQGDFLISAEAHVALD
jgi:hypothetical protein